jgi:hypothetical protein
MLGDLKVLGGRVGFAILRIQFSSFLDALFITLQ